MFFLSFLVALAAPVTVPSTRVTLDPPAGFELSQQFPGFTDGALGSITVAEMLNVPRSEMQALLTPDAIASKGMKELERAADAGAVLIHVEQTVQSVSVEKWMRIDGDDENTVMVVATVAKGDPRISALRTALETVELAPAASREVPASIRYGITPGGGLQQAGTFGSMQMFTLEGKKPPLPDGEPRFMSGPSLNAVDLSDVPAFARLRLSQLPFENPRNIDLKEVEVDGRPGIELTALATHPDTRVDRVIYQLVLPDENGTYFIAVGIGANRKELGVFRGMAHSLRFGG